MPKSKEVFMKQLGFIGTGNIATALIQAVAKGGFSKECLLSNRTHEKAQTLAKTFQCTALSNEEVAQQARFLILGVKPAFVQPVLKSLSHILKKRKKAGEEVILVSMAAGVSIKNIENMIDVELPILRILPNTPCAVGEGMILLSANEFVTDAQKNDFYQFFSKAGKFDEISEHLMDASGVIAGCSPAWAYLFLEGLADGAVATGVPREKALQYAAQAVLGAARYCLEPNTHPAQLKDAVCSPGGSTIAGVYALEQAGVRAAAMNACISAFEKTKKMI